MTRNIQRINVRLLSALLGLALGTGWMTSLRFWGSIGFSEIMFVIFALILFLKLGRGLFSFNKDGFGALKLYFLLSFIIIAPAITLATKNLADFSDQSAPHYLISFILGVGFLFAIPLVIKNKMLNMNDVTLVFFLVFITSYSHAFLFLPTDVSRFSGYSNNPNQPLFYLMSLSLLMSLYAKKILFSFAPVFIFIGLRSGSDAFIVSIAAVFLAYIVLRVALKNRSPIYLLSVLTFILVVLGLMIGYNYVEELIDGLISWFVAADEGFARISLMTNGLLASYQSPIFGWGTGSFSGVNSPFLGSEAHNNFIDLAMQFGIPIAILLHSMIFYAFFRFVRLGLLLPAAFLVGFLISGIFHFSARHFVFWVEIGVLMSYWRQFSLPTTQEALNKLTQNSS